MNELSLQRLIVDAVNNAGGFSRKLNNRYLIGVSDLLVKLPGGSLKDARSANLPYQAAGLLEVKQRQRPKTDAPFALDVTHAQGAFLQAAHDAGMPCGVVSFLQEGTGSGLKLWLQIQTWKHARSVRFVDWGDDAQGMFTKRSLHLSLGKFDVRHNDILSALYNWQKEWREGK